MNTMMSVATISEKIAVATYGRALSQKSFQNSGCLSFGRGSIAWISGSTTLITTPIATQPKRAQFMRCPLSRVERRLRRLGRVGRRRPGLRRRAGDTGVIRSRTLRTWGHSESGIAEMLADRIDELDRTGSATIAFLASDYSSYLTGEVISVSSQRA